MLTFSHYLITLFLFKKAYMVTIALSGGLGNQMFQYAAAKALATRLNTSLIADLYTFNKKTKATPRSFELDVFALEIEKRNTLSGKLINKLHPYIQKHRTFFSQIGFFTDTYAMLYQPSFEKLKGNITMQGNFQNEKYFRNIVNELRKDFIFRKPLSGKNKDTAERIGQTNAVAIHIRRGDYLTNQGAATNFVTCDKEYYESAINYISGKVAQPEFYIFSEDFEWIKENLNFGNSPVTYIDWNKGKDSYIDMQLMSLCKHNIIANSSFSWWAAWLNKDENKIVIAPSKWFQSEEKNQLLDDFYPKGWIKI